MLVLSRRPDQEIVFPNLAIKLQVLQVKGKVVKLGIDAPSSIPIVRPEACDPDEMEDLMRRLPANIDRHQLRNWLNGISLGLRLFQKQTEKNLHEQAAATMQRIIDELQHLDREIGDATQAQTNEPDTPKHLLVVDDNENERELLAGLLRLHGFTVDVAADGNEALDYLESHTIPDYLLLDMNMPRTDGPSTIRQIRGCRDLDKLKVFAVSGSNPQDCGVREGYSRWFAKPLDPQRLIEAMLQDGLTAPTRI